jgi:hypothetical protein
MVDVARLSEADLLVRAARGLGKVDTLGARGVTLVNAEEIEAMAGLLAILGLVPISPGGAVPDQLLIKGAGA